MRRQGGGVGRTATVGVVSGGRGVGGLAQARTRPRVAAAAPATLALILMLGLGRVSAAAAASPEAAGTSALQPVFGALQTVLVRPDDTLLDIAYRHRLGFRNLADLNPKVDPWIPDPGTVVRLPTEFIPPDAPHQGLVVNVPEMRLYDYAGGKADTTAGTDPPRVYAVAVGDPEDPTPIGRFRVGEKRIDPAWYVPASIRAEKPELPAVVAPGPKNPLGDRWMTIGRTTYGIHGTNNHWSIGRMATHGCVRLYEDTIRDLFERTPPGTPITIVYQPIKWGRRGDRLYVEVHPDVYHRLADPKQAAVAVPQRLGLIGAVDLNRLFEAVEQARGVPVEVGRLPAPSASRLATSRSPS